MNGTIKNNPDAMEEFKRELVNRIKSIDGCNQEIIRGLGHLSNSWQDSGFEAFNEQIKLTLNKLDLFHEGADIMIKNLERKIIQLQEIERIRREFK